MEQNISKSNLVLNNRSQLTLTGVKKVKSTEPSQVIIVLDTSSIIIGGSSLSVEKLDIKESILELTGVINFIKYSNQVSKKFSFKNIFK